MNETTEQDLLDAALTARRTATAAHAAAVIAAEQFYDAHTGSFDRTGLPRKLDGDRIAHTSALNILAAAFTTTAGAVEEDLKVWWGSRPAFRELFTAGTLPLPVLRTIRDHSLGASAQVLAAIEDDIITATRHFERTRLGREIDRMITAADPDFDTRARRRAAATNKKVRLTPLPRGLARMSAVLGAVDAAELTALIDRECATVCALDPRTLDTRRADAYTALMRGAHLTCHCGHTDCTNPDTTRADTDTPGADTAATAANTGSPGNSDSAGDTDSDDASLGDDGSGGGGGDGDSDGDGDSGGGGQAGEETDHAAPNRSGSEHTDPERTDSARTGSGVCDCGRPTPPATARSAATSARSSTPSTPLIHITADLETVLGLHNHSAYLHGYGHLDPTTLRRLAADATWQIIFTTSRAYLDTLTECDPYPPPTPHPDTPHPAHHTPHCTCTCGDTPDPGTPGIDTAGTALSELLTAAAAEHDRHTAHLPTRMSAPPPDPNSTTRQRTTLTPNPDEPDSAGPGIVWDPDILADAVGDDPLPDTPDLILGRTRVLPAGHLPTPDTTPDTPPRRTPTELAEHYHRLVTDDPVHSHAEHPDGHGGHPTPPPGALTYTPGAALALFVRAHHPTCRHPGCTVPSSRCDLDHIVEFDHHNPETGGWTINTNLAPYCRTHHNLKTSKHWHTELLHDDVLHTTDPLGNHYFHPPEM